MRNYSTRLVVAILVVAALALWSGTRGRVAPNVDPYGIGARIDRFAPVVRETPPDARFGYASRAKDVQSVFSAQFALAPRLLVRDPAPGELTISDDRDKPIVLEPAR